MTDWYFLTDPKTKEKSVSLTLLIVTFVFTMIGIGLNIFGKVQNTGQLVEVLYSMIALYFGRRFTFKGQQYSSDKAEDIIQKVEKVENEVKDVIS